MRVAGQTPSCNTKVRTTTTTHLFQAERRSGVGSQKAEVPGQVTVTLSSHGRVARVREARKARCEEGAPILLVYPTPGSASCLGPQYLLQVQAVCRSFSDVAGQLGSPRLAHDLSATGAQFTIFLRSSHPWSRVAGGCRPLRGNRSSQNGPVSVARLLPVTPAPLALPMQPSSPPTCAGWLL